MKYTGYFTGLLLIAAGAYCALSFPNKLYMYWGYFLVLLGFLRLIYTYYAIDTQKKEDVKNLHIDDLLQEEDNKDKKTN